MAITSLNIQVLKYRFVDDMTLYEVAEQLNCSKSTIDNEEEEITKKTREVLKQYHNEGEKEQIISELLSKIKEKLEKLQH